MTLMTKTSSTTIMFALHIIEQDVEELPDSNAETIDPKEDWIKKWQCLPNVATAINERAAAFAGDVRRIRTEACVGNGDESEYLPHRKVTTSNRHHESTYSLPIVIITLVATLDFSYTYERFG